MNFNESPKTYYFDSLDSAKAFRKRYHGGRVLSAQTKVNGSALRKLKKEIWRVKATVPFSDQVDWNTQGKPEGMVPDPWS